jgi:Ca2+ transporting ATPase
MDTLAALALATEVPTPDLLLRKPHGRFDPLVNRVMWINILAHAMFQLLILLIMLFKGKSIYLQEYHENHLDYNYTMVFNSFVYFQLFNEFNCRVIDGRLNVFRGVFSNWLFGTVWVVTAVLQAFIVQFGSEDFFKTKQLSADLFFLSCGIGALSLPFGS